MKLALAVTLAVTLAALAPTPAPAADFYMFFDKCKFAVGYLVQSDESLKVFATTLARLREQILEPLPSPGLAHDAWRAPARRGRPRRTPWGC